MKTIYALLVLVCSCCSYTTMAQGLNIDGKKGDEQPVSFFDRVVLGFDFGIGTPCHDRTQANLDMQVGYEPIKNGYVFARIESGINMEITSSRPDCRYSSLAGGGIGYTLYREKGLGLAVEGSVLGGISRKKESFIKQSIVYDVRLQSQYQHATFGVGFRHADCSNRMGRYNGLYVAFGVRF